MDGAITIMARQRMINLLMRGTLLLLIGGVFFNFSLKPSLALANYLGW